VIFYDQAGCGDSTFVKDVAKNAPWLLTTEYYVEELDQVVSHLKIDKFHLFGNSWGGMLVMMYALSDYKNKIAGLIVSGGLSDAKTYIKLQQEYLQSSLPPYLQEYMRNVSKNHNFDDPKYKALSEQLTGMWTSRTTPPPDCVLNSRTGANQEIYVAMQGPDEFSTGGVLGRVNFTANLTGIVAPTLMTHGKFDTMVYEQQQIMADLIPNLHAFKTYPQAGHMTFIDNPKMNNDDIAKFISDVES